MALASALTEIAIKAPWEDGNLLEDRDDVDDPDDDAEDGVEDGADDDAEDGADDDAQ